MSELAKAIIYVGLLLVVLGALFYLATKVGLFGSLPGDFAIKKKSVTIYFPLASSLLISILLTGILFIIRYFRK